MRRFYEYLFFFVVLYSLIYTAAEEKKGIGEACEESGECSSSRCVEKTCTEKLATGEACAEDADCETGICFEAVCAEPKETGETCLEDYQCATAICWEKECIDPVADGGNCGLDTHCLSGNCEGGLCVPGKAQMGEVCAGDLDCDTFLFCQSEVCQYAYGDGQFCERSRQCLSTNCDLMTHQCITPGSF